MAKPSPLPQEYFDENRELFNAETTTFEIKAPEKHDHIFYKKTATEVACRNCTSGWLDPDGRFWQLVASK